MRKIFSTLTAIVAVAFMVDAVQADTQWQADGLGNWNGNWSDPAHWNPSVPTSTDKVTFPSSGGSGSYTVTLNIGPATGGSPTYNDCKYLDVHANATLSIPASNMLRIYDNGTNASLFDGKIVLAGNLSAIRLMGSTTFQPKTANTASDVDVIQGQNAGAFIDDDNNARTLTFAANGTSIPRMFGCLQVDVSFANNGLVNANSACTLSFISGTLSGSGAFLVSSDASAVLQIGSAVSATSLAADFIISVAGGTLDFDANVTTSGGACIKPGVISVALSKAFSASGGTPARCP